MSARVATAVIGAGPAGLLFSITARLLAQRAGLDRDALALRLCDKRSAYARTHRLRMAPEPYLAIQRDVADPRFDALVAFLGEEGFAPEVNRLEERLSSLLAELGVAREVREVSELGPLIAELDGARKTIVAADSVHSAVRERVRGDVRATRHTHERVARVRVIGESLPKMLGVVERYRLGKVLGSIVDYRLNRNGFAEVDLFLEAGEHDAVRALGATPASPVPLRSSAISGAPLFRAIVANLERGASQVLLQSTFELEHAVMPQLVFEQEGATIFLVGDAAVSLPFFRGMSSLARCAHALARAHVDLALEAGGANAAEIHRFFRSDERPMRYGTRVMPGTIVEVRPTVHHGRPAYAVLHRWLGLWGAHVVAREGGALRAVRSLAPVSQPRARSELASHADPIRRYDRECDEIKEDEIAIVRARARLVRALRELVRLSSLLPFPIQRWWLSAPDADRGADPSRAWTAVNACFAVLAAALVVAGSLDRAWLAWLALPIQAIGGVAYRAAIALEEGPHRRVRRVWELQIALVAVIGVGITTHASWAAGSLAQPLASAWWVVLAITFVVGIYTFERAIARHVARAAL